MEGIMNFLPPSRIFNNLFYEKRVEEEILEFEDSSLLFQTNHSLLVAVFTNGLWRLKPNT